MTEPKRIQRKRTLGWRLPDNTVIVDRTSRYGNPWRIRKLAGYNSTTWIVDKRGSRVYSEHYSQKEARVVAVERFRHEVLWETFPPLAPLRGKDLACTCDPDDGMACHADTLLELANRPEAL